HRGVVVPVDAVAVVTVVVDPGAASLAVVLLPDRSGVVRVAAVVLDAGDVALGRICVREGRRGEGELARLGGVGGGVGLRGVCAQVTGLGPVALHGPGVAVRVVHLGSLGGEQVVELTALRLVAGLLGRRVAGLLGRVGRSGGRRRDGVVAAVDQGDRAPDQQGEHHQSADDDPGDDRPVAALTAPTGWGPHRARRLGRAAAVGLLAAVARAALCRVVRRLRRTVGRRRRAVLSRLAGLARLAVGRLLRLTGTVLSGRPERSLLPAWLLGWVLRHHALLRSTTAAATTVSHGTAPAWRQRPEPISILALSPGRLTQRRKPL